MDPIVHSLLAEALITPEELAVLRSELEAFTRTPDTLMSVTRIIQVWGLYTA